MKKIRNLIIVIIIFLFPFFGFAQIWIPHPNLTTNNINDIEFFDSNNGWLVGNNGTIGRFQNGNWQLVLSPTTVNLVAVQPVDSNKVWILGSSNLILLYDNGNFIDYTPNFPIYMNDFYMLDSTGWCVGNKILYFDGTQWIDTTGNFGSTIYDVDFYENNGFMSGLCSSILNSSNGFQSNQSSSTVYNTCIEATSDTSYVYARMHSAQGIGATWVKNYPENDTLFYSTNPFWMNDIELKVNFGWAVGYKDIFKFDPLNNKLIPFQIWHEILVCGELINDSTGWIGGNNGILLELKNSAIGVDELKVDHSTLSIQSNPTSNNLNFTSEIIKGTAFIFDLEGRLYNSMDLNHSGINNIDVSNLSPSVYLLILKGDGLMERSKFIKIR